MNEETQVYDLKQMVSKKVVDVEYQEGSFTAYIVLDDGSGVQVKVEPVFVDEEE